MKSWTSTCWFPIRHFVSWYPLSQNHLLPSLQILECWDHTPRTKEVTCILNWSSVCVDIDIENHEDPGVRQPGYKHNDFRTSCSISCWHGQTARGTQCCWRTYALVRLGAVWHPGLQVRKFLTVKHCQSNLPIFVQFLSFSYLDLRSSSVLSFRGNFQSIQSFQETLPAVKISWYSKHCELSWNVHPVVS